MGKATNTSKVPEAEEGAAEAVAGVQLVEVALLVGEAEVSSKMCRAMVRAIMLSLNV